MAHSVVHMPTAIDNLDWAIQSDSGSVYMKFQSKETAERYLETMQEPEITTVSFGLQDIRDAVGRDEDITVTEDEIIEFYDYAKNKIQNQLRSEINISIGVRLRSYCNLPIHKETH